MLRGAAARLRADRVALREQDLADPLPPGPFDLVASALAIHHLEGIRKAALFERVAAVLMPDGRFVLGDVVVPTDPADAVIEIEPGYDFPSTVDDQSGWLRDAGFEVSVFWSRRDLAVIAARLREG